jgi:uncharacterized iron-regulated protein
MAHSLLRPLVLAAALALLVSGCCLRVDVRREQRPSDGERPLASLDWSMFVWDTRQQRAEFFEPWLDLAFADVVFVGETHLDDNTHRVELQILEGLEGFRQGKVVLSLEMFERDVQPVLDDYLAGRIPESEFLARARPWGNYESDYRPLVEFAKAHDIPVVAANAPVSVRRKLASGGRAALDALPPEERAWLPAEILPASASYWERVDRATRGHMGFASQPEEQRLFSGQNLWDNCMGDAVAKALAAHPGHAVVHVVGGFHVMNRDGTAVQLARRAPEATFRVVEILPTSALAAARPERDAECADYLVYVESTARSLSDGQYAVAPRFELRFSLDVPADAAGTLPLLVYLPDADERPADARAFWRAALGDEVALAVVEPPFPERADDLADGGRWNRSESFAADQGAVQAGLERLVEYVTRRFPVDGARVAIAGRGLGATSALSAAFGSDWLAADYVLAEPRGEGALRLEGLPDRAPATRAVTILAAPGAAEGVAWLRDDLGAIGTLAQVRAFAPERSPSSQLEDELRAALGLGPRPVPSGEPLFVVLERDTPRARQWAEVRARQHERAGRPARVVLAEQVTPDEPTERERLALGGALHLANFAEGRGLPLSPGAFGGTTVVVVLASAGVDERTAWRKLEEDKVLRKRSMFAGLRVAFEDAEPRLATVLAELVAKGTRNALVVPATFCAFPHEMQALRASIDERSLALELTWLPGLGAELVGAVSAD